MNHREICRKWAKGSTKTLKGYAIFTNGEGRIYSWGHHYIMGQTYKGDSVALINSTGYSASTAKHTSYATRAAARAGLRIFMVPVPDQPSDPRNYLTLEARITETRERIKRARTNKAFYEKCLEEHIKDYADYKELFPLN